MASPVPPASSRSPMPPSPASPSCRSTLLSGLMGGLCVGAVAAVVLFICCGKKNRQSRDLTPHTSTPSVPTPGVPTPSAPQTFGIPRFTLHQVKGFTNNFSAENKIGGGGFGSVYEGLLPNGEGGPDKVAVKRLDKESRQGEPEFKTEVENLSRAHHKHVVSLVGYCTERGEHILVYELVPNKTIEFHLHENEQTLDWPNRRKIALGSAKGLAYLHEYCNPRIIHRDIKANNILLDGDYEAKIADFGLAKCIPKSKTHVSTAVKGTPGYIDPECYYYQSRQLTEKTDIYSFGMVLLELITGRKPTEPIKGYQGGLYDWVLSELQLSRYMEDGNFNSLVDPRLQNVNREEMAPMVRCAVACVYHFSKKRPKMSTIVRELEGPPDLPQSPTHLFRERPGPSSDAPAKASKCPEETPLGNQKNGSSHHGEPTPGSRGAGPSRRPLAQGVEMQKM